MARKRSDTRSIELQSGGTVTVGFDFSIFDLTGRDREFVTYLIDMIRDYEAAKKDRTATRRQGSPSPGAAEGKDSSD